MSQAAQQLMADLRVLAADAEQLVIATANQTGDRIENARGRIKQSVAELRPKLAEAQVAITENARAAANATDTIVRENPWAAIGAAAAVGLALGLLIGRR